MEEREWSASAELMRLNPLGRLPVLAKNGRAISGSQAIAEFIDEKQPDPPLRPSNPEGRAEMRRLINWFDTAFNDEVTQNLLAARILLKLKGGGQPGSDGVKIGSKRIKWHLDYMNHLLERRRWLAGDQMSLADFTAAAHLSCLDYINDVDWKRHETVYQWYATLKSRPAFRSLLADHLPGFPPPDHYTDLDF